MNTNNNPKSHVEHAAAWILKSLYTNIAWFDEIRLAGRKEFEKKFHYIPLIDISLVTERFDITTLKDACYLLKNNEDVDIWGDDFEPYGMLVQISEKGKVSYKESSYKTGQNNFIKRGLTAFAALIILVSVIVGVKKTTGAKQDKSMSPTFNKKISESTPKATAFLNK
jgi:hypothetical protein